MVVAPVHNILSGTTTYRCEQPFKFRSHTIPDLNSPRRTGFERAHQQCWHRHQIHQARPGQGGSATGEPHGEHGRSDNAD